MSRGRRKNTAGPGCDARTPGQVPPPSAFAPHKLICTRGALKVRTDFTQHCAPHFYPDLAKPFSPPPHHLVAAACSWATSASCLCRSPSPFILPFAPRNSSKSPRPEQPEARGRDTEPAVTSLKKVHSFRCSHTSVLVKYELYLSEKRGLRYSPEGEGRAGGEWHAGPTSSSHPCLARQARSRAWWRLQDRPRAVEEGG